MKKIKINNLKDQLYIVPGIDDIHLTSCSRVRKMVQNFLPIGQESFNHQFLWRLNPEEKEATYLYSRESGSQVTILQTVML